jgi:hypothetical protein
MNPAENIEKLIKKFCQAKKSSVTTSDHMDKKVLGNALAEYKKSNKASSADIKPNIWRIIMKSKMAKFAAAAVIIIAALIGMNQFGGSIDVTSVAWGEIVRNIADVDFLHYYEVTNPKDGFPNIREGWYSSGKMKSRSCGGYSSYGAYQSIDDGKTWSQFDRHNNVTVLAASNTAKYNNIFEVLTDGELSFDYSQFQDKIPTQVGSDFLIYDFEPPAEADWIEKISVTVGRNSLMPIQIKTYYKTEQWYSISQLILFDYEEPPKPIDFFNPPAETKPPHGIGRVVLGGEEVEIGLHDAPGIKKAIVRLHTKFDGPAEDLLIPYRQRYKIEGVPMYFMEITFIIDEGYRSNTMENCPLWIDKGVKAALGKKEIWPDKKHRNIRFTPVLRVTDKEDEFLLELSSWLRIKQPGL